MTEEVHSTPAASVISISLIVFTLLASGWGVLDPGVYRDNLLVRSAWYGNDLVTSLLAVPLLTVACCLARRQSPAGSLLWMGMLAYLFYNFAFYTFGAAFNNLFLVYVLILVLSTFGLILGFTSTDLRIVVWSIEIRQVHRMIGLFIIVVAMILGVFWIVNSFASVVSGQLPAMVTAVEHPTNITAALDLWLVVPFGLLGGIWLWQRRAWGYVIAAIWVIKGSVYMCALSAANIAAYLARASEDLSPLGLWVPIGVGCIVSSLVLLRSLPGQADSPHGASSNPPSAGG